MNRKLTAAVIALALGLAIAFVALVVLAFARVREETLVAVGSSFAAPLAGLLIAGWKRPEIFISAVARSWHWLNRRLTEPLQRATFLASVFACTPWLIVRVIGESFENSTIAEYARSAYYPLANTVLELGGWGYQPHWYDWLMLLALLGFLFALFWQSVAAPFIKWVRGENTGDA